MRILIILGLIFMVCIAIPSNEFDEWNKNKDK